MIKNKNNSLFHLIKNLSKAEIKYYLAYYSAISNTTESKYVNVFRMISKQTTYNENEILQTIKSNRKSFLVLKSNLYYHILKALRSYNSSLKPNTIGYIQNASILLNKNMIEEANTQLNIAEKKASTEEQIELLPEIERLKALSLGKSLFKSDANKMLDSFFIKSKITTTNIQITRECQYYKYLLGYNVLQQGHSNVNEDKVMKKLNLIDTNKLPTLAHTFYLEALAYYHFSKQDYKQCEVYWDKAKKIFELNQHILEKNIKLYISIIYNLLYSHLLQNIFDERIYNLLEQLHQIHLKIKNNIQLRNSIKTEVYQNTITTEIDYYLSIGQHQLALEKTKQAKIDLSNKKLYFKSKDAEITLQVLFAQTYFMHKDYDLSLMHIMFIIEKFKHTRVDYQCQARIFSLIIHYEKESYALLPRMIRSAIQYAKKRARYTQSMNLLINFIKDDINLIYNKKERKDNLIKLKQELKNIETLKKDREAFINNFFISAWVESKINNKTMAEILKKKNSIKLKT